MKKIILVILLIYSGYFPVRAQENDKLWYRQAAATWTEALPIGNGRLGAMIFGRVNEELIQLNESTLWSGGPIAEHINPDAPKYLPQIREALRKEDYETAIALTKKMQGLYTESYMPLADLRITQRFKDSAASHYYRALNINQALATTTFRIDGTNFKREIFASAPDQVIVIRITADQPGQLNMHISAVSQLRFNNSASSGDRLIMQGKAPVHVDPSYQNKNINPVADEDPTGCRGMRFELMVKAIHAGGTVHTDSSGIEVVGATELTLLLSAATSFNGYDHCPDRDGKDEKLLAATYLQNAANKSYQKLLARHLADYQQYFNRVSFNLNDSSRRQNAALPSDLRLDGYSAGAYDPGLETLFFQYGRYLLISSSRPGGTPANLQGIWNKELRPPWSSNFTININTQMNYWPAEPTNLSEMHAPLLALIQELSVTGRRTAKEFYGLDGWVAHHNTDIWATTNPVGDKGEGSPRWANWAQGGNWLCQDLWEHYQFTKDKVFLRQTAYPIMKDAATFCLGWLIEDESGYLVVSPSVSPENVFRYAPGKESDVSVATTMDMSIIWDLFSNLIEASTELGTDKDFRQLLVQKKAKLFPLQIGQKGNLQEWNKDWDDVEVHHRHVSHLFGLHPGHQIAPVSTPEFAAAAKKTLEIRGDEGTGWSKAWKINFWARLLEGNHAYLLLKQLLHTTRENDARYNGGGGTYPNFFDAHPPFQIDGNFGATAGMTEMLLQSHLGEIHLLPALPDAWNEGEVKGLKARGNFEISMHWKNHLLQGATVRSVSGGICRIRTTMPINIDQVKALSVADAHGYLTVFKTEQGKPYHILTLRKN